MKNTNPRLITSRLTLKVGETADALGISTSTVRRLIKRGFLKPLRQLRHLLIPVDQVNALVAVETTRSLTVGRNPGELVGLKLRSPGQISRKENCTSRKCNEALAKKDHEKGGETA